MRLGTLPAAHCHFQPSLAKSIPNSLIKPNSLILGIPWGRCPPSHWCQWAAAPCHAPHNVPAAPQLYPRDSAALESQRLAELSPPTLPKNPWGGRRDIGSPLAGGHIASCPPFPQLPEPAGQDHSPRLPPQRAGCAAIPSEDHRHHRDQVLCQRSEFQVGGWPPSMIPPRPNDGGGGRGEPDAPGPTNPAWTRDDRSLHP